MPKENSMSVIAAFDFDGTITRRDTFLPFLFYAFGYLRVLKTLIFLIPDIFKVGLGFQSRDKLKESVVRSLFTGEDVERMRKIGYSYANTLYSKYRPKAITRLKWHQSKGHICILVSASLDIYLHDAANLLGFNHLLCTSLSHNNIMYDGFLNKGNCRKNNKVLRLKELMSNLSDFEIYGYGDSDGDAELLNISDHKFFKPFN